MASFGQIACLLFFLCTSALASRRRRERNCFAIAPFCANLTKAYTQMRLPNFLGHNRVGDVTDGLRNWNPLVGATAGEHHCPARLLKIFLCSIYAPVCIESGSASGTASRNIVMKIEPCQSLCVKVRDSCNPVMMSKANMSWPSANNPAFNCSSYIDNAMCVKEANDKEVDILCSADLTTDELLKEVCASEFVHRIELLRHRKEPKGSNGTTVLRAKAKLSLVRNHKKLVVIAKKNKKRTLRLFFPANSGDECDRVLPPPKSSSRPPQYLVTGKFEDGGKNGKKKMILTLVVRWKKHYKKLLKANACSQP